MRSTIADIAQEAGVSLATVSRVLNDKAEGVSVLTRQRIKDIIVRRDYEPCGVARGLATGKSRAIGLVIPDIADPFFPLLIRGIEATLRHQGYGLFLCDSDQDIEKEKEHIRMLLEKRVDGVILNSTHSDCDCQLELLDRRGVPYVLLDRMIEARASSAGVYSDNRLGARMAMELLLSGGNTRFLFINGPQHLGVSHLRRAGVEDALGDLSAAITMIHAQGDYSVASGERAVDSLLDNREPGLHFQAVFAANDRMAIGAIRSLKRRGYRVPQDIEVVGFDDIELAQLVDPGLTTVAQPAFDMGRASAELLFALSGGLVPPQRVIVLEPKLVVRGTTRPR